MFNATGEEEEETGVRILLLVVVLVQIKMDGVACCPPKPLAASAAGVGPMLGRQSIAPCILRAGVEWNGCPVFQAAAVLPFRPAAFFHRHDCVLGRSLEEMWLVLDFERGFSVEFGRVFMHI